MPRRHPQVPPWWFRRSACLLAAVRRFAADRLWCALAGRGACFAWSGGPRQGRGSLARVGERNVHVHDVPGRVHVAVPEERPAGLLLAEAASKHSIYERRQARSSARRTDGRRRRTRARRRRTRARRRLARASLARGDPLPLRSLRLLRLRLSRGLEALVRFSSKLPQQLQALLVRNSSIKVTRAPWTLARRCRSRPCGAGA